MQRIVTLCASMTLLALMPAAHAATLEIAVGNDMVSAELAADSSFVGIGGAEFSLGGLINDDDDRMLSLGLLSRAPPTADNPFAAALGVKLFAADIDEADADSRALTLGLELMHHIPARWPMAIGGRVFYAPNITTWGDGKNFLETGARFEINFLPNTTAFLGYRRISTKLEIGGTHEIDDATHLGIRIQF
ncbi:MAG: YfaZ family outer membrane protein [Thiotrichales bacterium]